MLCQDCRKREAQVHLTQIINQEKTSLSLCKECASKRGFHSPLENVPFPLAEILAGITSGLPVVSTKKGIDSLTCTGCGMTFEEFTRLGRFGCGDCYRTFRNRIEPIMRKIHGNSLHRGSGPDRPAAVGIPTGTSLIPVQEEERLETELRKAIEGEDFERAAELRDKLKTVRPDSKSDHVNSGERR